jgi:hypothetical protein
MGLMKNEYESHHILEFAASASKSYAIRLQHRLSGKEKFIIKTKGLRLSADVCQKLPFQEFKKHVLAYCNQNQNIEPIMMPTNNIQSNKLGNIFTIKSFKKWTPYISKGIILENTSVVPFGYYNSFNTNFSSINLSVEYINKYL